MDRLLAYARALSRLGAWFGCALLTAAAFVISTDVFARKLFNVTIGGADELSGYALAIGCAWSFAFTLTERAHVRIDSLYVTLPTRLCALLDILGLTVLLLFFGFVTYFGYGVLLNTIAFDAHSMSPLGTPLVYPQALWAIGLTMFLLVGLLLLVRAFMALVTGDIATVGRLIGSRTVLQEIEQEIGHVEAEAGAEGLR
jgi:TRAP-type mannitol/chloroaromatic compound transport system permease small subunit